MGSCNGLVLLFHNLFAWDVSIQNPFTKSFYKIPYKDYEWPEPRSVNYLLEKIVYGFGYDSLSDDVKVVRNVQFLTDVEKAFYSSVDVYSLKMKSWKKVESFPYYVLYEMAEGVFIGGALHWL
ncbi:hypothetical protein LIER_20258 [Lithospermum erythrorhizon]|uniref:F-box associated beta-propeller type 1 domain-containing protein n=1 Tax=Lithospermum erythrorhizon TaxID=34254 RepID=A0AAV3QKT2_LITER